MNFVEKPFFFFVLIVYALWLAVRRRHHATVWLLVLASLVFYAYHRWELVFLILAYCLGGWFFGLWIARSRRPGLVLTVGVSLNLLGLCYWKYTPLLVRTALQLATAIDLSLPVQPPKDWAIPLGISFFSFVGIAYLVDVYRKDILPEPNLLRFTLFKTFFPQLVAGPILRAKEFLPQLQEDTLPRQGQAALEALHLLACGFFKKMVLADRIAVAIDPFFTHVNDPSTAGVWAFPYVVLYALQIYFDFSGYTDIARGLGLCFGFRWPDNFRLPYLAFSIQSFWQRWHMTLSSFLRDYLYIPLGGNRRGPLRTYLNLMATMVLGGLWHGASWSFLLWGGLHGSYLVVNRLWGGTRLRARLASLRGVPGALYQGLGWAVTFTAVVLAWCFFRLTALSDSLACVRKWVVFDADKVLVGGAADASLWVVLLAYGVLTLFVHAVRTRVVEGRGERGAEPLGSGFAWGFGLALLLLAVLLAPAGHKPAFIYFEF